MKQSETKATFAPDAAKPSEIAPPSSAFGRFAFAHRDFFASRSGELLFRNIMRAVIGVIPTAFTFVLTRMGCARYNTFAQQNPNHAITRFLVPGKGASMSTWQQVAFIFGGFSMFRGFCKLWQRSYDRLFAAKSAAEASRVISDMPGAAWKDFTEIAPAELAGTAVAAFPLATIKTALANPATIGVDKGQTAMAKKGFLNDWMASVPAYLGFFELNDRLYSAFTRGKDSPAYYDNIKGKTSAPQKDSVFTRDNGVRLLFHRVVSLIAGVAPYIALQRFARAKFGMPNVVADKGAGGFLRNVGKEYASFAGFAAYTAIADIYTQAYDGFFSKTHAPSTSRTPLDHAARPPQNMALGA